MFNDKGQKISNVEWGLVIGALFAVDLIQIVLEWMVIGLVINPFVDIFVGMSFALYLQLRGQSMADPKRLFSLVGAFFAELVPGLDELPLWGLDGIISFLMARSNSATKGPEEIPNQSQNLLEDHDDQKAA
ncbi:hypothetical protein H0W91_01875 [Patescibacteria group bacterium]|nr:hypothetical protein [Patescibacteria group bacterium]